MLIIDFCLLCLLYCISTSSFTFVLHLLPHFLVLFFLVILLLLLHLPLLFHHPQLHPSSSTFLSSTPCVLDVSSSSVSFFLRDDCFPYSPDQDRRLPPRGAQEAGEEVQALGGAAPQREEDVKPLTRPVNLGWAVPSPPLLDVRSSNETANEA